jgi:hypothetical protein
MVDAEIVSLYKVIFRSQVSTDEIDRNEYPQVRTVEAPLFGTASHERDRGNFSRPAHRRFWVIWPVC